jgi:predicted O-methyltransferase YrrM
MAAEMVQAFRPTDIPGWMTDEELSWLTQQAQRSMLTAEVGVWKGRSTAALLNGGTQVWASDLWVPYVTDDASDLVALELKRRGGDAVMQEFLSTFRSHLGAQLRVFRADSKTLANEIKRIGQQFDFVFIDGDHSAQMVQRDIYALWPVLRQGGVLAGHDFHMPSVQQGVMACLREVPRRPAGVIWAVVKP